MHATTLGTRLFTWFSGHLVGTDAEGNRYFRERRPAKDRRQKRWVVYKGKPEASRVPAQWHAWLHHTVDTVPTEQPRAVKPWQKEHLPNRTGTTQAYRPPGHDYEGGKRARATGDYEPWRPS